MDKRYKVFHITYKVYSELEWMLKEKIFNYERQNNLLAVSFSVMYDKENEKFSGIRDAAIAVEFTDNKQKHTRYIKFKSFRINYRLYSDFEDLLELKIKDFEEKYILSHFENMSFSVLNDCEADEYDSVRTAVVLIMFYEKSRIYASEREKISVMTDEEALAYRTELDNQDKSYSPEGVADIYSKGLWDEVYLSNFSETDFEFDGIQVKSMEGFLQSLKTNDEEKQIAICSLVGKDAKTVGSFNTEFDGSHLYWKGKPIDRFSEEYLTLLKRVYHARFEHDANFRKALEYTKNKKLIHTVGKSDPKETILTDAEFINLLSELQKMI